MVSLAIVLGTRPEIIKMAPIILETQRRGIGLTVIHTGQHYDNNMSQQFFKVLGLAPPDINLGIKLDIPHERFGLMIQKLGDVLSEQKPDIVLALGDTTSVLACCLACIQCKIPFGHIEAGLRSFDLTMPEEINRKLVDSVSSILFAPSEIAVTNLEAESIEPSRIFLTGNTFVDVIRIYKEKLINETNLLADSILEKITSSYIVCTIHRLANVQNSERFQEIISSLIHYQDHPILFFTHPRTSKKLESLGLDKELGANKNLHIYSSIDYLSMLKLISHQRCLLVLTDSGGLQEEAAVLRKPCVTIRPNTERPETVKGGINTLVDANEQHIIKKIKRVLSEDFDHRFSTFGAPYGDGFASTKILDIIEEKFDDLRFQSPETYKAGAKTHYLFELGANIEKEEIEKEFDCTVISVYNENGEAVCITDKLKKGFRLRILKN